MGGGGGGAAQGDSRFVWGTIRGMSQNGGSRVEENDEEEGRVKMDMTGELLVVY